MLVTSYRLVLLSEVVGGEGKTVDCFEVVRRKGRGFFEAFSGSVVNQSLAIPKSGVERSIKFFISRQKFTQISIRSKPSSAMARKKNKNAKTAEDGNLEGPTPKKTAGDKNPSNRTRLLPNTFGVAILLSCGFEPPRGF